MKIQGERTSIDAKDIKVGAVFSGKTPGYPESTYLRAGDSFWLWVIDLKNPSICWDLRVTPRIVYDYKEHPNPTVVFGENGEE